MAADKTAASARAKKDTEEMMAYWRLMGAAKDWASNHMDQWENMKVKVSTPYGDVYVNIIMNMHPEDPENYTSTD